VLSVTSVLMTSSIIGNSLIAVHSCKDTDFSNERVSYLGEVFKVKV